MNRGRRVLLILLGCALVVAIGFVAWPRDREPSYQGRTLSEWTEIYERGVNYDATPAEVFRGQSAREAVCQMQNEVLPRALLLIRREKPEWKNRVMRVMESPLNVRRWCPRWVWVGFYREPADDGVCYPDDAWHERVQGSP